MTTNVSIEQLRNLPRTLLQRPGFGSSRTHATLSAPAMHGAELPDEIRLGMPHLGPDGLSEAWLLRECAHRHWHAIAGTLGVPPSELRDVTGARVFASIVSLSVEGSLAAFSEDQTVRFTTETEPRPDTGWHSVTRLSAEGPDGTADGGPSVRVSLSSLFAKRRGASNRDLAAADMPHGARGVNGAFAPRGARILRGRSKAMRLAASEDPPIVSARVVASSDMNGVGLLYFASFPLFIELAERETLSGPWGVPPVSRREIHYYGNADDGETLDMTCEASVRSTAPEPDILTFTTVRRRSDGALIAACETRRGGAEA